MSKYIVKSLEWVPLPGLTREMVLADLIEGSLGSVDLNDHVWTVDVTHRGPTLCCYALFAGLYKDPKTGREFNAWYVKRIPEAAEPDVYDCPLELMEQAFITSPKWREQVRKWHAENV